MYIVYGKKKCVFCENAIRLLRKEGYNFQYYSMDEKLEHLARLFTIYNWRTVPLILKVEGNFEEFIGGYDDLVKRLKIEASEEDDKQVGKLD
jgi:glutaredoxin